MADFIASGWVFTIAHLAFPCQAVCIGFGSERMANMTSSSANWLLVADMQHQEAASRLVLHAGQCQRLNFALRFRIL